MIINLLYFQLLFVLLSILHIPQVVCQSYCSQTASTFLKALHREATECFCLVHYVKPLHLVRALNSTPDSKALCCNVHTTKVQRRRREKQFTSCVATNLILGITLQQVSLLALLTRACVSSLQVLLGLDNAHHDDGESNHHSCGNNLLLRADYHHLAGLQRGLRHHLPGGPGHELQDGDRQRGELRDHPRPQSHQDELPEELVCRGLPLLHSGGLYLFNSGERL